MSAFQSVFVVKLGLLNTIRILASGKLRRAMFVYHKEAGFWGRLCFPRKLRPIADHYYAAFRNSNFVDYRAQVTIQLAYIFDTEPDRYFRRVLQQALAWSVYAPIGLIQDHELTRSEGTGCVLVPFNPFLAQLRKLYATETCWISWGFGSRRIRKSIEYVLMYGLSTLQALWTEVSHQKTSDVRTALEPAVSVLNFRGGQDIGQRSDFFWSPPGKPDYPLIFEYASSVYPVSENYADALRARGIRIVETHRWRRRIPKSEQWRPGRIFLQNSIASILRFGRDAIKSILALSLIELWKVIHRLSFELQRNIRKDFYQSYNIRVELLSGFTLAEPAHSAAMKELNGATCSAQYSVAIDPWASYTSTSTFHLNFGEAVRMWGFPFMADFTIFNGYLFKTPIGSGVDRARTLRQRLGSVGVKRVLCFLDEGLLEFEPLDRATISFCRFLFRKLAEEPDFGVIIKPKKDTFVPALRSMFRAAFDNALASNRLITLEWSHYPGIAGLAADLTVAPLSTAPLEVAIAGARTVYLNPFGYVPEFLSQIRSNIYDSVEDAIAAVEAFLDGTGHQNLGIHPESFLQTIDTPRDNEVSNRIELLLSSCLKNIREGISVDLVAQRTLDELCRHWPIRFCGRSELPSASIDQDWQPALDK